MKKKKKKKKKKKRDRESIKANRLKAVGLLAEGIYTREQVGGKCGVTRQTIWRWESKSIRALETVRRPGPMPGDPPLSEEQIEKFRSMVANMDADSIRDIARECDDSGIFSVKFKTGIEDYYWSPRKWFLYRLLHRCGFIYDHGMNSWILADPKS